MNRTYSFDNGTKRAVISDHGWYRIYHSDIDSQQHVAKGEVIQEGSTDELGLIHNFVGDTLFIDPNGFATEEIDRRLTALCGKSSEERLALRDQERAACIKEHFGVEFKGRWEDHDLFTE